MTTPGHDEDKASRPRVEIPEGHERGEALTLPQRALYRAIWLLTQVIARTYFRLRTKDLGKVPATGPFIVAPIHRSNLDTPVIGALTRRRLRYMGKESMWKYKASAWFFTTAGGFPVVRGTADRAALRACVEVIERGEPLVMFPEGTRQSGPVVCEMFDGPAYVACKTGAPLLPVGIGGSEAAMPKGSRLPRPTPLALVVGDLIHPPPRTASDRVSRKDVKALTLRLSEEIQRLFDEAQVLAGTPNPPAPSADEPSVAEA
jgi:1-acyl-sn-glycerol-3-phosphate acyltransferase